MRTKKGTYKMKDDLIELLGDVKSSYQWSVGIALHLNLQVTKGIIVM
jgi:hypothetical protein